MSESEMELLIARIISQVTNRPPPLDKNDLITSKQLSELLGVSKVTLIKWRKEGKLKFYRFGSRIRYSKSEIFNNQ